MSDAEWKQWVESHTSLFWMYSAEDADLFRLWRPSLQGFLLAELQAASLWIAETHAGQFRTAHLMLLRRRVAERRQEALGRAARQQLPEGPSVCGTCGGTGLVAVPHCRAVVDGEWRFDGNARPVMVVACRCHRGANKAALFASLRSESAGRTVGMTLDEYAQCVPHWRDLLAEENGRHARELEADAIASRADRKRPLDAGAIKQRLAGAMALPREPAPRVPTASERRDAADVRAAEEVFA
jgi:hypothetical protein